MIFGSRISHSMTVSRVVWKGRTEQVNRRGPLSDALIAACPMAVGHAMLELAPSSLHHIGCQNTWSVVFRKCFMEFRNPSSIQNCEHGKIVINSVKIPIFQYVS